MAEQSSPLSTKRRAKFALGGTLVAVALPALIVWGLTRPQATAFYLTVSEAQATTASASRDYKVNGKVVDGSIQRDGLETHFVITDGRAQVPVVTDGPLPDTFKSGSEVVVRGTLGGGLLTASEVLAKCPSKFKAKA